MSKTRKAPGRGKKIKDLLARIAEFLEEERPFPDHTDRELLTWVREGDVDRIVDLLYKIVDLKYQLDDDGSGPIHLVVTDETRFRTPRWIPVRHHHKGDYSWEEHLADRITNLQIAADEAKVCQQIVGSRIRENERVVTLEAKPRPGTKRLLRWLDALLKEPGRPLTGDRITLQDVGIATLREAVDENRYLWEKY